MKAIYTVNEYVRYALNGICKISEIKTMQFSASSKPTEYYVLNPVGNTSSKIYVPTENEKLTAKMNPIISIEELDKLILSSENEGLQWIDDKNARNELFRDVLNGYDQLKLLGLMRCIYLKRSELVAIGKKLPSTDENALRQAEKMIQNEFSFVLGIPEYEVNSYIRNLLEVSNEMV